MKPKGVIFDFDGVIVDSLALHLRAWDTASRRLFGTTVTEPDRLAGRSTNAIASILANENNKPSSADELANLKRDELNRGSGPVPIFPGVPEVFAKLRSENIPFGIASNAPRHFILQALTDLRLEADIIVGIEDAPRPKPFPDPFLLCAARLAIAIDDHAGITVYEDSRHGLGAAKKAGMIPIGVTSQHPAHELLESGAVKTCAHLRDALDRGYFDKI